MFENRKHFIAAKIILAAATGILFGTSFVCLPALGAEEPAGFKTKVRPFFAKHCLRCHSEKKQSGEFRIDTLDHDFTSETVAQKWGEVLFRVNSGEMPPEDEPQPKPEELGELANWISARINEGRAARMAKRGSVSHYRLSRDEYAYTVFDMLGVHFDVRMPGALNEDPRWHGFDRIGSMLTLSPSHVDRYFAAAEAVLEQAFPVKQPPPTLQRKASGESRWLLFPGRLQRTFRVKNAGLYKIRVQLSAVPSFKGRMPRLALWNDSLKQSILGRDVVASEDHPTTVTMETFLPAGTFSLTNQAPGMLSDGFTVRQTPGVVHRLKDLKDVKPFAYKLLNDQGESIFPLLLVDWAEIEGPILSEEVQRKRGGLVPQREGDLEEARLCLNRFIDRAWRRPATEAEVDRYTRILESELAAGEKFRSAYRTAMTGVLISKNFYYLVEGSPAQRPARINDWELASRLSYFLWSSTPDEELFVAAAEGNLRQPEVLLAQMKRMLKDEKIARFTDTFPQQWLQLHRVGMFAPDAELYPDYDPWLERSMILEATGYFGKVFGDNLSIDEFLSSDWAFLNSRLAMHYGMDRSGNSPLNKPGFHRVALKPTDHRGGLLTQAAVLSLTSDGTRHRPVHRGVWVSEAIFGTTPPPPPPNVEPLETTPSDKPKATIRDQLEAHATHSTCASCHQKIDPLGFAFDNYDAIGRWRAKEQVSDGQGEDPLVNASGILPDGRAYQNPREFKQLLASDLDRFAEAFVEQLATFALRRVMTIDDTQQIHAIAQASKRDGYRLQAIMENLVLSDLFQKR